MKVRWTGESVRFRITPAELEALTRQEAVEEVLALPEGGGWRAVLAVQDGKTTLTGGPGTLQLQLSREDGARLATPETEGVYFAPDEAMPIRYYVEKDFPCAHPRAAETQEPASPTFDPPAGFQERKNTIER